MITLALLAVGLVLLVPCTFLFLQVMAASPGARRTDAPSRRPSIAVLVPAHDESSGIVATLECILPQLASTDRCLVVADNCTDDTAAVARAAGASVIERSDATRRGKGFALDFGLRALEEAPPDVVVMIDADCQIETDGIARLSARAVVLDAPVQALYLMRAPADASYGARIAEFAWCVKNRVRPLGLDRFGLPCQLMGSGMAFPWRLLQTIDLASGHIVEDMKLGIDLAAQGSAARFCPEVLVTSSFPTESAGTQSQRTRWEHGHLSMMVSTVPRLLALALRRRDGALLAIALDLTIPPLALLVMLVGALVSVSLVVAVVTNAPAPLIVAAVDAALVTVGVGTAWWRFGRENLPLAALAHAPWYALAKIPLYARFLVTRQTEWIRSKRDLP